MGVAVDCASTPKALETGADFTGFITEVHPIGRGDARGQVNYIPLDTYKYFVVEF